MKVAVYSLKKVLFEGEAISVTAETVDGEITILNHHRPLVTMLKMGVLKVVDMAKQEHFVNLSSGFLEVNTENQVKVLADEAAA
jgi:F-type H+-transporting ATPase subunit epsilon